MSKAENIHPVFDKILNREEKEHFLKQKGKVIWLTGLSGSGKTTNAVRLERKLNKAGFLTQILDGDNIRSGINSNLSFTLEDRLENIRRIAEVSKLFLNCGVITINCFVSPTTKIRQLAKDIIGEDDFLEIYLSTPIEECERRDVKGLYAKARDGKLKNFTGIDSPFEEPLNPFLEINTKDKPVEETSTAIFEKILPIIEYK